MANGTKKKDASPEVPTLKVRFNVSYIQNYPGGQIVRLQPIDDLDDVNKSFALASPVGVIELDITNEEKHGFFEAGKTYDIEFTPKEAVITPLA